MTDGGEEEEEEEEEGEERVLHVQIDRKRVIR